MEATLAAFIAERWAIPRQQLSIDLVPLQGGLDSRVARATITAAGAGLRLSGRLVVKELRGARRQEAAMYRLLLAHIADPPIPALLGARRAADDAEYLYLEDVAGAEEWPWTDVRLTAAVCRVLARLHQAPVPVAAPAAGYEAELRASAEETLRVAANARDAAGTRYWRRLGDLQRVVRALPQLRAELLARGATLIHGDMHPGNVRLRGGTEVVLLDWGRARTGAPLEDVAAWLQSVGCWEPEARRRHDTLLRAYCGGGPLPAAFRREYWLAGASNALAGAVRYHLVVLNDPLSTDSLRYDAWRALRAWERVIRRASALLATTPADRTWSHAAAPHVPTSQT